MSVSRQWFTSRVAFLAVTAAACGNPVAAATTATCNASSVLEQDGVAVPLAAAVTAHAPTDLELKVASLLWGEAVLAAQGVALDPLLTEAPISGLLQTVPTAYPSLFAAGSPCETWAVQTGALIGSDTDFACGNSCVPSPKLLANTGKVLLDSLTAKVVAQLKTLNKTAAYAQLVQDQWTAILAAQKALRLQYQVANKVYTHGQQVLDLLGIIDKTVSLADSQTLLADVTQVIGQVASLVGAEDVAAVVLAFQIGLEIGTTAQLVASCTAWQASHCGASSDVSSGDTTGGRTLEGPFKAGATYTDSKGCVWHFDVNATVTVDDFGGDGTLIDPYHGTPGVSGILVVTDCSGANSLGFDTFTGTVGGTTGKVVLAGTATIEQGQFAVHLAQGVWDGQTVSGTMTLGLDVFVSGLTASAPVVLAAP